MVPQGSLTLIPTAAPVPQQPPGTPMEVEHNRTYNLSNILFKNITSCFYYSQNLAMMTTLDQLFEEIKKEVTHLEPMDKLLTPSKAFCILVRMMQLKLTE